MSSLLQRAADASACQMLNDIGSAGTQLAAWTMWAPKVALVPLTVGGLSYMANNLLCGEMDGPPTGPCGPNTDGCIRTDNGYGYLESFVEPDGWATRNGTTEITEILSIGEEIESSGIWGKRVNVKLRDGSQTNIDAYLSFDQQAAAAAKFRIGLLSGECASSCSPDSPGTPNPPTPDYEYTDPETNCNYTLKLEGFVQQYKDGPAEPVWNIRSSNGARADGGRMGACNLSPTIYIGGDGSGGDGTKPPQFPVPPEIPPDGPNGVPWWLPPLLGATTGALLNQIGRLLNDTFNYPMEPGAFELIAPCDYDEEGTNETRQWAFPQTPLILRLHDHQVAMTEIMQQHLDWRTPTCGGNAKPTLEGQWVTTRWLSDEKMAHSGVRLRKLFRYRTKSALTLGQLSRYWAGFSWKAGDVCVFHKGAWWGTPQVWAQDEDEGKRVLRFAATEAGLDPDQIGEWGISSSRSPRYGMSGTMRIHLKDGFPWGSARDGASWPNTLAR